jgi:hypothetical protein
MIMCSVFITEKINGIRAHASIVIVNKTNINSLTSNFLKQTLK